jgi:tRNA nucleotidyltransferase/poly(A) polymerase
LDERGAGHRGLIVLAALLHDVAKAETARTVEGRLRFFGHDTAGAERTDEILKRLRFSRAQIDSVHAAVLHHLRPGHLAAGGPITEKAIYRFFRDLGAEAATLLLVCWADHASYLPEGSVEKWLPAASAPVDAPVLAKIKPVDARKTVRHLQIVSLLMRRLFAETKPVPERLLDGKEVMKLLRLKPGPEVGEVLERLREAQATGSVRTREDAVAFLRRKAQ